MVYYIGYFPLPLGEIIRLYEQLYYEEICKKTTK